MMNITPPIQSSPNETFVDKSIKVNQGNKDIKLLGSSIDSLTQLTKKTFDVESTINNYTLLAYKDQSRLLELAEDQEKRRKKNEKLLNKIPPKETKKAIPTQDNKRTLQKEQAKTKPDKKSNDIDKSLQAILKKKDNTSKPSSLKKEPIGPIKSKDMFNKKAEKDPDVALLIEIRDLLKSGLSGGKKEGGILGLLFGGLFAGVIGKFKNIIKLVGSAGKVLSKIGSTIKAVGGFIKNIPSTISKVAGVIKNIPSTISNTIKTLKNLPTELANKGKSIATGAKTAIQTGLTKGKDIVKGSKAAIQTGLTKGKDIVKGSKAAIQTGVKATKGLLGGAAKMVTGAGGKAIAKTAAKVSGKTLLKRIPIIGSVFGFMDAMDRFGKGDPIGGLMALTGAGLGFLDLVAPGVGTGLSIAMDIALAIRDAKKKPQTPKNMSPGGTPPSSNQKGDGVGKTPGSNSKGDGVRQKKSMPIGLKKLLFNPVSTISSAIGGVGSSVTKTAKKAITAGANLISDVGNSLLSKKDPDIGKRGWFLGSGMAGNMEGLNPNVRDNFTNMSLEYQDMRAKAGLKPRYVQVNSGYRSLQEQEALYKQDPSKAARPGSSLHNFGFAIDMNSDTADDMEKKYGLLSKYGFDRPAYTKSGKHERWHIQPKAITKSYSNGKIASVDWDPKKSNSIGDGVGKPKPMGNSLPSSMTQSLGASGNNTQSIVNVKLADEDIVKIAKYIGTEFNDSLSKNKSSSVITTGSPSNPRK